MNGARTVYAVHLNIADDPASARPAARALARRWLVGRFGPWPQDADPERCSWSPRPGESVTCRSAAAGDEAFWEVTWRYPHQEPTLQWRAVVLVGGSTDKAWAQVRYGIEPSPGCEELSGWVSYDARRPHLAHTLVAKLAVVDGGRRLSPAPMRVEARSDVDALVALIEDPGRRLPVIVGTRRRGAREPDAPLPALADSCIGLAHVVDVVDPELTFELGDQLGRRFAVHSGSMRAYFAGWSPRDPPSRHPLWTSDRMHGDRYSGFGQLVAKRLFALAAFRTPVPALVDRVTARANRARIAELQAAARTNGLSDDVLAAWEEDLARLDRAEARIAGLIGEAQRLSDELRTAHANLDAVTRAKAAPATDDGTLVHTPAPPAFTSVADAVEWAARHLPHLEFHPRALATARTCQYRWPNRLLGDLCTLDRVVATWQGTGRLPGGWAGAAEAAGLGWANDVSHTARTRYRADYEVTLPDGAKALLGPHLRRGAATGPAGHYRAYLHIDPDTRTVTVGYIGAHLRDSSNP